MSNGVIYTQWNYIPLSFNKNLIPCTNLDNIILKDEDGVQIKILEAVPGNTSKNALCIIPIHRLDKNKTYSLLILRNTIQTADGDFFPEEISFVFKTDN